MTMQYYDMKILTNVSSVEININQNVLFVRINMKKILAMFPPKVSKLGSITMHVIEN